MAVWPNNDKQFAVVRRRSTQQRRAGRDADPNLDVADWLRAPVYLTAFALIWLAVISWADALLMPRQHGAPLILPFSAGLYFLCGVAITAAQNRVDIARAASGVVLSLSSLSLVMHYGPAAWRDALGPLALPLLEAPCCSILSFVLALGILLSSFGPRCRRFAAHWAGAIIIAAVLLWFLRPPALFAGEADNLSLLLAVLGGTVIIALSRRHRYHNPFEGKWKLLTAIALGGTLLSTLGWYAVTDNYRRAADQEASNASARVASLIQSAVRDQLSIMGLMSLRWGTFDHLPPENLIEVELGGYLNDFGSLDLIAVLDDERRVRWMRSRDNDTLQRFMQHMGTEEYVRWLALAQLGGAPRMSPAYAAAGGHAQVLIASPLRNGMMQGWTIVAVDNMTAALDRALQFSTGSVHFKVFQNELPLHDLTTEDMVLTPVGYATLAVHPEVDWQLSWWRLHPRLQSFADLAGDLVLLIGLSFTFFLLRTQRLLRELRLRSFALQQGLLQDPLTGLPNKRRLEHSLQETCHDAWFGNFSVWVVLLNVDGLKLINDSMGHACGDEILIEIGKRIQQAADGALLVARLEGDEFVAVFTQTDRGALVNATQRILEAVAAPCVTSQMALRMTASAGITTAEGPLEDAMELVRQAHLAMARAKREGRNAWREYTADLGARVADRLQLRTELQQALEENSFSLEYQPLIDGQNGRIVCMEALLRWRHPVRGNISPALFVPGAEETGQIIPLSEWVLDTVCRDISDLRAMGCPPFPVAFNVSPLVFQRPHLVESIRDKLESYGLPGSCLQVEITEGLLLDNTPATITKLSQLRELGIQVAIDDFGTGYSSLSYLKRLPIDKIKIDRAFVQEVTSDRYDAAIIRAIIDMAHQLGLKVVAEGVETEDQYWFLLRQACDEFQGYLFARPMPLEDVVCRLKGQGGHIALPCAT